MEQLVEQVEVNRQKSVTNIDGSRADKDPSGLVKEAKSVYSMRWLRARSHQEERDFSQDC